MTRTRMTSAELVHEADTIKSEIDCMVETDDNMELITMYAFALERLCKIYRARVYELCGVTE